MGLRFRVMTYPVQPIRQPAALAGQPNGKLPASILTALPGLEGSPTVTLQTLAARAFRAMAAAALVAGVVLRTSSAFTSYRPYAEQERIFRERYTTTYLAGRPYKVWDGRRWYQRPGTAVAAVPGRSNHGLGLAIDHVTTQASVEWLRQHAYLYGWSWEIQSEPWHLHYFAGDAIPAAVLAYEHAQQPTPPPPAPHPEDEMLKIVYFKGEPSAPGDQPDVEAVYLVNVVGNDAGRQYPWGKARHLSSQDAVNHHRQLGFKDFNTAAAPLAVAAHTVNVDFVDGPFIG